MIMCIFNLHVKARLRFSSQQNAIHYHSDAQHEHDEKKEATAKKHAIHWQLSVVEMKKKYVIHSLKF